MPVNAFTRRQMPGGVIQADVDRDAYSNALMRQQVAAEPDRARMRQLDIQGAEQQLGEGQKQNAAGILGRGFAAIANSPNAKAVAQQFVSSGDFQAAGRMLGLPLDQFTVAEQDTDDALRQVAAGWAQAMQGQLQAPPEPQFSDPYEGPDGSLLQRDPTTGKVSSVIGREPRGTTVNVQPNMPSAPQGWAYKPVQVTPQNPSGFELYKLPGGPDNRTEAQAKAGLLSSRMRELSADVSDAAPTIPAQLLARIAQSGGVSGGFANAALTPEQQKHFNAARGWLAGVLRQDTGATIQPFEIQEYYPTFFPVPGDSPQVIEQKRKLRAVTERAISANSGGVPGQGGEMNGWTVEEVPQ